MSRPFQPRPRRRVRNVRVVREPDRVQTRMLLWGLLGGLVVLVPLLLNVWGHAETVRLGYRIQEARKEHAVLSEDRRLLRTEHANQRDLARVQEIAVENLGLEPRQPSSTIVVSVVDQPSVPTREPQEGERLMLASRGAAAVRGGSR